MCDECDTIWRLYEDVNDQKGSNVDYILNWIGERTTSSLVFVEVVLWPRKNL